jgi:glycosyltransferase involved in cell wall biosynthesis
VDIVHHVTLGAYWKPSFLALLPVRFVWGPVGGGEKIPRGMRSALGIKGKIREILRDIAQRCGGLDPFVRLTARKAELVLAATPETQERVRALGARRVAVLSHVGLPAEEIQQLAQVPIGHEGPFRILSLGRLLHWKGHELALRAFQQLHRQVPEAEYWIIGNGPERRRLETLTGRMGLSERVTFWGELPRATGMRRLSECDVLLHPSLHDSGAWVCAEAMAAARPVVCLDCGGPAMVVTPETGFKITPGSPKQVVGDLAAALCLLALDADRRRRMGVAARERVQRHLTWDSKGEYLEEYLLSGRPRASERTVMM